MSAETVDVVENAWQRAKGRALRSEGCPAPSCREGTIEMLDLMHDELVNLPAKVAAQVGGGENGTTLEFGRLRIRGKSAVTLAVKYGSFAVVVLAVLYLVARVHGWIPAPVSPQAAIPATGPTVAADTRDVPAG
jgi:hypothetical protein